MWCFVFLNYVLLIIILTSGQECNMPFFNNITVNINTLDNMTRIINLKKCTMSPPTLPTTTTEITCANQNISELPALSASYLPHLKTLYLNNNRIQYIRPNAFYELPSLKWLDLSSNDITSIWNSWVDVMKPLQTLRLENNLIKHIDDYAFRNALNLRTVDLNYNELTEWNNEWFSTAPYLSDLNMQGNRIKFLPRHAFANNKRISIINFSFNDMTSIHSETFWGLHKLFTLRLDNNKIKSFHPDTFSVFNGTYRVFPEDFFKKPTEAERQKAAKEIKILSLYIDHNRLTFLPKKMLNDLNRTSNINIHSNPFQCACYFEILHWIKTSKIRKYVDTFKKSCMRKSNPVCVASLIHPFKCIEENNEEVQKLYYANYKSPDDVMDMPYDIICS